MASKKKGFSVAYLDKSVRPQDDFFQYACGGWIKNNPIPETKPLWGTFYVLREEALKRLHAIVKDASKKKRAPKGSDAQLIRDFYRSGMDMRTRDNRGIEPIREYLTRIESIETTEDALEIMQSLFIKGFPTLFSVFVGQDDKNSEQYITHLTQSGLSLPDRDFYLKGDKRSVQIRKAFVKHIENILVLTGESRTSAKRAAGNILSFETKLARISMSKVDSRTIDKVYNKKSITVLQKMAPMLSWRDFFKSIGLKDAAHVVVYQPDFIMKALSLFKKTSPEMLRTYLKWSVIDDSASFLSSDLVEEHFAFYGKVLTGRQKMEPLWKRVTGVLEGSIGEVLGKEYVKRYFPPQAKKKINTLVDDLFVVYRRHLQELDWMSDATKKKALRKLSAMTRKLGYPDKWKTYRGLVIAPDDYAGNLIRTHLFERKRHFSRLGKKVDRKEWFTTPQTVNAYYSPNMNEIVFPAGILQPPFFDPDADDAFNYGAIGAVIGHEITHGFDDEGSKFDSKGNYKNWWKNSDRKRFENKTKRLVDQFNKYKVGDLHINGKLTLGENIADLGGAIMAFNAHMERVKKSKRKIIHGYTPEQRFFLGLALFECGHERPEIARMYILTDSHSPSQFRVNGPASNLSEFYEAFGVKKGDKLYREPKDRAKIW